MDTNALMFGLVAAAFIFIAGYALWAVILCVGVIGYSLVTGTRSEKAPAGAGRPSNMLEPIVIESTRGPPYLVPPSINLWVKPDSWPQGWYEKAVRKGIGRIPRIVGMKLGGEKIYEKPEAGKEFEKSGW
jgi:hypothetical protein